MLGYGSNDVIALLPVHLGHAFDGEIVTLSSAGGEDYLFGGSANQLSNLFARSLDGGLGFPAKLVVAAGGVAELLREVRQHGLNHSRICRGGGVVVQIDRQLDSRGQIASVSIASITAHRLLHLLSLVAAQCD